MHLLQIELDLPMPRKDVRRLRGAVAERAGWKNDLFHNHRDGRADQYHYRYPLVQYKVVKGHALVLGLNAGAAALHSLLEQDNLLFAGDLPVRNVYASNVPVQMLDQPRRYMLRQWLALNPSNYARWQGLDSDDARYAEMERVLVAHLLSFAQGIGFTVPRPRGLDVQIERVESPRTARCHEGKLLSFDVVFYANMLIPPEIGIGKAASHGFGICYPLPVRTFDDSLQSVPTTEKVMERSFLFA